MTGGVAFNSIPDGWKLPLVAIEVDPSKAGTAVRALYGLLVGYKVAAGSAPADIPVAVGNPDLANSLFGAASPLARAYAQFFALNKGQIVYCLPITPPSGGTAATGTITFTAPPTVAGTYDLYIAGQHVPVGITSSMTTANVATAVAAAINAKTSLPVTATASTNTVPLTCAWKGITGNDIRVEDSYYGANGGEVLPAGLAMTYPANNVLSGGAGVPDFTNAIANLSDDPYEFVSMPFTDSASLVTWETEYGFSDSGRWGWMRQSYGHVFSAIRDTYSNLITFGAGRNSGVISIMTVEPQSPAPIWEWAAAYTSKAARALSNDPARPLQTLTFDGILPAPKHYRWNRTELNGLASTGLAVQTVVSSNMPQIVREQTTYQKNSYGQPDNAYELVTTLATLAALFRRLQQAITNKFPRHKLANDGTRFGPGQAIVTPLIIKAELISEYRDAEFDGLVENAVAFKNNLIVVRNSTDPNRLDVVYPPDVVNQLRFFAVLAQFRLQYDLNDDNTVSALNAA